MVGSAPSMPTNGLSSGTVNGSVSVGRGSIRRILPSRDAGSSAARFGSFGRAAVAEPDVEIPIGPECEFTAVVVAERLLDGQHLAVGGRVEHVRGRVERKLRHDRSAVGVGEVDVRQVLFRMERQTEEALFVAFAPEGDPDPIEGRADNVRDVEHDDVGLVVGRHDGSGLLDDEQAGVAVIGGELDRTVERAQLEQADRRLRQRPRQCGDRRSCDVSRRLSRQVGVG